MKEISNRQFQMLVDKLPQVIQLARAQGEPLTIRQSEDIRLLDVLHKQLRNKHLSLKINSNEKK